MQGLLTGTSENVLTLTSEEDAWKFLENLQKEDFTLPRDISFGDWCNLTIYLKGEKWSSSITTSIFPVFEQLQQSVNHAYAKAKYSKKVKLTKEEKEQLEIIIKVSEGSSDTETKINWTALGKACISKMTNKQIFSLLVIIALLFTGTVAHKDHLQNTRDIQIIKEANEDKKAVLESMQFMSEQETTRMTMLVELAHKNEITNDALKDSSILHKQLVKTSTKATTSKVNGVELTKEQAEILSKSPKTEPTPKQINGVFEVLSLDWKSEPHKISLRRVSDKLIIAPSFQLPWLSENAKEVMKNTEWNESGPKYLQAKINARFSKGKVVDAELVDVDPIEPVKKD